MGILEERRNRINLFLTVMTEKFPKLTSDMKLQIQASQRTPNRINGRKITRKPISFELQKIKRKKEPERKISKEELNQTSQKQCKKVE